VIEPCASCGDPRDEAWGLHLCPVGGWVCPDCYDARALREGRLTLAELGMPVMA
jgi:hypothetical protein